MFWGPFGPSGTLRPISHVVPKHHKAVLGQVNNNQFHDVTQNPENHELSCPGKQICWSVETELPITLALDTEGFTGTN